MIGKQTENGGNGADLAAVVSISHLNKWYDQFHVLRDISLDIRRGDKVVICGPSGSGKSTMIRCINGLEPHQSGSIRILGQAIESRQNLQTIRREVGMVFQQFNLFPHLTVLQNLVLAPKIVRHDSEEEARDRAIHYLEKVRLADSAHKYPAQLSGGQQQRVAIARALCMEPKIMLFDEPTSALDPETIGEVLESMMELAESGMTMVCVTHELGFARRVANRVIFMDGGSVIEESPPDEFFDHPKSERLQKFLSQILH